LTAAPHSPASLLCVTFAGQVIAQDAGCTITVKLQLAILPEASVAVQVTVVVPTAKLEPVGGLQLAVAPGQLSVGVGAL
jgi:hypothetical protein